MPGGHGNCLTCGSEIVYFEQAQDVECVLCGTKETGHCICAQGHYVCDACHRAQGVDFIIESCLASSSRNPIALADELMENQAIFPNGPEHHTLFGAALLTAYRNAGGQIDLESALVELRKRSMQVPGGACGFWGTCGAAISAGQFMSIATGSTPMKKTPWTQCQRLTADILARLADIGGPRCCKRMGFIAMEEAVRHSREVLGVEMEMPERIICRFVSSNKECLRISCPFFESAK